MNPNTVVVLNTSRSAGEDVPQVYLSAPKVAPAGVELPVRKLVAFDRIRLAPGESKRLRLAIPLRQIQYWSTTDETWKLAIGERVVHVGASSRDIRLTREVRIDP